jgi:hypothetical protein
MGIQDRGLNFSCWLGDTVFAWRIGGRAQKDHNQSLLGEETVRILHPMARRDLILCLKTFPLLTLLSNKMLLLSNLEEVVALDPEVKQAQGVTEPEQPEQPPMIAPMKEMPPKLHGIQPWMQMTLTFIV